MSRSARDWEDRIREYMKNERRDERIPSIERYREDRIDSTEYQTWNLETDKRRYWIILPPIRYYPQERFPSLEFALTFSSS